MSGSCSEYSVLTRVTNNGVISKVHRLSTYYFGVVAIGATHITFSQGLPDRMPKSCNNGIDLKFT